MKINQDIQNHLIFDVRWLNLSGYARRANPTYGLQTLPGNRG
jgi:hypothetical protein